MTAAIACVGIPHFSLRVEVLDRPELDGMPLVLSSSLVGRNVVEDCTPEAAAQGIQPGMSLREVIALLPGAVIIHPDPVRDATVFARIVHRLEAFSPLIEPVEPASGQSGHCYVDLRGLDRLYGSPEGAAAQLLQAVPPVLRPRVGVAPGKFAARVAAGQATPGTPLLVPATEVATFLSGLPATLLPLPLATLRRLEMLGLRTMGDVAALPASAIQARFGLEAKRAWELARGHDESEVRPRPREEIVIEELTLPAPATSRETLLIALRQLVIRAFGRPVLRSRHVRQARVRAQIEGGRSWEQVATLREPAGRERLIEVLRHRFQSVELPGPLEALTLELVGFVVEVARQQPLLGDRPRRRQPLIEAIRQLKQRYGVSPIYRIMEVEPWSRIPERRRALISYDP